MVVISPALPNEFNIIQDIAKRTWPVTYGHILSEAQLEYMLGHFYSLEKLNQNFDEGHQFLLAWQGQQPVGFAAFELEHKPASAHIHKLYVLPDVQGAGIGSQLISAIENTCKEAGQKTLSLNVNRNNAAKQFYDKLGFKITQSVDILLDHGYLMEDFVMEKEF